MGLPPPHATCQDVFASTSILTGRTIPARDPRWLSCLRGLSLPVGPPDGEPLLPAPSTRHVHTMFAGHDGEASSDLGPGGISTRMLALPMHPRQHRLQYSRCVMASPTVLAVGPRSAVVAPEVPINDRHEVPSLHASRRPNSPLVPSSWPSDGIAADILSSPFDQSLLDHHPTLPSRRRDRHRLPLWRACSRLEVFFSRHVSSLLVSPSILAWTCP